MTENGIKGQCHRLNCPNKHGTECLPHSSMCEYTIRSKYLIVPAFDLDWCFKMGLRETGGLMLGYYED